MMTKPKYYRQIMVKQSSMTGSSSCSSNDHSFSNDCKMYKGVRKRKWGKWVSEIRLPNSRERIWLGSYDTQDKAARAFDAALFCLRGKSASFNFPDTPQHLLLPQTPHSHQQIQHLAAKFANNHSLTASSSSRQHDQLLESSSQSDQQETKSNITTGMTPHHQVNYQQEWDWDWTCLDDLNGSDFGLYFRPDMYKIMHLDHHQIDEADDAFSNHSYLWSWNF